MKNIAILILLVTMATAADGQGTRQAKADTNTQRVAGLVADWFAAEKQNDVGALEKLIGDDFVGTTFGGNLISKGDLVSDGRGPGQWSEGSLQEVEIHSFGDTAAAIGKIVFKDSASGTLRFTEVWTKRATGWQLVVAHLSKV